MYRITLRSVGNPDFGQDPYQPMSPTEEIMVDTLQQASNGQSIGLQLAAYRTGRGHDQHGAFDPEATLAPAECLRAR